MAEKKTSTYGEARHRAEAAEIRKLKVGDHIEGILTRVKIKMMKGKAAEPQATRCYFFKDPNGVAFMTTGATMMDDQFDEILERESNGKFQTLEVGGEIDPVALSYLVNFPYRVERGQNSATSTENTLGTYEVTQYDKP